MIRAHEPWSGITPHWPTALWLATDMSILTKRRHRIHRVSGFRGHVWHMCEVGQCHRDGDR